jgi:hypothetical protein
VIYKNDRAKTVCGMYASNSKIMDIGVAGDLERGSTAKEIRFKNVNYEIDYAVSGANPSPSDALDALPVYAENDGGSPGIYRGTSLSTFQSYEVRLIDQDGNGKVDYVVYLPFAIGQVSDVSANSVTIKDLKGYDVSAGKTFIVLDRSRNQTSGDGTVRVNDYVKIIPPQNTANKRYQVQPLKSFEGAITAIKANKILVNQTWYDNGNGLAVQKDKAYIFYAEGTYLYYVAEVYGTTIDKLVYLQNAATGTGTGVDAKLYFTDGSSKTVPLKGIKLQVSGNFVTYDADKFDYVYGPNPADRYPSFLKLSKGETGLYTYIEKNNEYILTEVCQESKVGFGDYAADPTTALITPAESGKAGILKMKGISYSFADDALVFVNAADGIHIINGAKAAALFNTDSTSGVNTVKAALIQTTSSLPEDKGVASTKEVE